MFVYKIQHKTNPSLIYIGSTDNFEKRVINHKTDCYNKNCHEYNLKKYKIIRDCGGFDAFDIQIIDVLITEDKLVRRQLEQYYMDKFNSLESMNSQNAFTDREEYHRLYIEKNRTEINAKKLVYNNKNRIELNAKQSLYYEANRDLISAKARAKYLYNSEIKRLLSIAI